MKKVVITGATSMIGVALMLECLRENIHVIALIRKNSSNRNRIPDDKQIEVIECNLNELEYIEMHKSADAFYHLGWDYTKREERNNPEHQELNIQYTLAAVKLAKKMGCTTFIGAGSQAEYGRVTTKIRPDTPTFPDIAYGMAKNAACNLSRILCEQYGIRHNWVRIFSVYGIYDNVGTMIDSTIKKLLVGEQTKFTKSEQQWDYLFSEDAGRAFYLVGEKGHPSSIYCLGSGQTKMLKDYIQYIKEKINPEAELGIGDLDYSENQVMYLCADISDLTKDTGFKPRISFEEGIEKTIAWHKSQKE